LRRTASQLADVECVEGRLLLDGVVGEHFAEQLGVGVSDAASEHECLVAEPLAFVVAAGEGRVDRPP
jgi:hypothetical protein